MERLRSFLQQSETNLGDLLHDEGLARRLRAYMAHMLPASLEITPQLHAQRATPWNRFRWRLCRFLVAALDYTVSRKLNLGL